MAMIFNSQSLDLETSNLDIKIQPFIKFLKVKATRYGMYFYLPIEKEESKRKISDIVELAYDFYTSAVPYDYLFSLQYDDVKIKANKLYKKRGYVLWKDLIGHFKFKELITDCSRENTIELTLSFDIEE